MINNCSYQTLRTADSEFKFKHQKYKNLCRTSRLKTLFKFAQFAYMMKNIRWEWHDSPTKIWFWSKNKINSWVSTWMHQRDCEVLRERSLKEVLFGQHSCSLNDMHGPWVHQISFLFDVPSSWKIWTSLWTYWVCSSACRWSDFNT